jgi:peptidoglycan/xylan/chitin deacetylase (PgdA/CDA1 family)
MLAAPRLMASALLTVSIAAAVTLIVPRQANAQRPRRFRPLILCYHGVSQDWDDPLVVHPESLKLQVKQALRSGYVPATAADTLGGDGKLLHVTFDDAFRSIRSSLDHLLELGVPTTVFACTDRADDGGPLIVDRLADLPSECRSELETMRWDELRELAGLGIEIGSHTCSHAHLTRLSDAELDRELRESKARLVAELGRPCRFLAFPFGEHDARVREAVRAAGYTAAFALPGRRSPIEQFALARVGLYNGDSARRAAFKMSTPGRALASARDPRR